MGGHSVQQPQQLSPDLVGYLRVRADDEDSVVAGDGADDLGPLFVVECHSNRAGMTRRGPEDHLILGDTNIAEKFGGEGGELRAEESVPSSR